MKIQHQSMRTLRFVGLSATVSLFFLLAFILFPLKSVKTNAIPSDYVPSTTSLTLGIGNDPLILDLEPTSPNGTFKESSTMSILASTDNYTGYTLTLDTKEDLDHPTNITKLLSTDPECLSTNPKCYIESITTITTASDYTTPSTTSAINTLRNTWGISPSQYVDSNNTTITNDANDGTEAYLPITNPITIAKTTTSNIPNTNNETNTYTLKLGARIDTTLPTGTYENTFVFTIVSNAATYTINYLDPSNEGTNLPTEQSGTTDATSINLSSTVPARANYTFSGWCSAELVDYACNDTVYQPNDTIYLDYTTNNTASLYAIWTTTFDRAYIDTGKTKFENTDYYSMQDMSSSICNLITEHEETQLIDERDNKVYYVAKLADKRCWMTQNLDHDIVTTSNFYTYANTDIGHGNTINTNATWTAPSGVGTWTPGSSEPKYYDPGNMCWSGVLDDTKQVSCTQNGNHYHIGNYYTWVAAVVLNSRNDYNINTAVDQSICPASWKLPASGNDNDVGNLVRAYGWVGNEKGQGQLGDDMEAWSSPLYLNMSGTYIVGQLWINFGGGGSYYYNSSYETSDLSFGALANTISLYINTNPYGAGMSIRCLAR